MTLLDEMLSRIGALPPDQRAEFEKSIAAATKSLKFVPSPGPQTLAWFSPADILLFGGSAGSGKTSLGVGLSLCEHRRSLLMRREGVELTGMIEEMLKFHGSREGFSGAPPPSLRTGDGRLIEFGSAKNLKDEESWQGRPHDLLYMDEVVHFLEAQVRFLMGWVRTTEEGQRTRTVFGSNPPISADGQWIVGMFRPWLDITHPRPAKHGELRWFVTDPDGKDFEVAGPEPYQFPGQPGPVKPMSRTFIPGKLSDNPYLARTDYGAKLDALPEPLRSAVRDGNFMAARQDASNQVIPTAWVLAAQERWKPEGWRQFAMTAMGFDPAGGGRDSAEIAYRHGGWYGALISAVGPDTADGSTMAAAVLKARRNGAPIVVDVGGGYAGAAVERFKDNDVTITRFDGAAASTAKAKHTGLSFANKRAEAWWKFREELDPDQEGGSAIALPPDTELRADLTTPTWELKIKGILVESKDEIRKRLGRSPGKGDAVVMALSEGNRAAQRRAAIFGSGNQMQSTAAMRKPRG